MRKHEKGFSLIELLIVVAIILIIAAIAIPNLIRSKIAANETSAVASLRTINTAEVIFSSTYSTPTVFATKLTDLGDGGALANCDPGKTPTAVQACLIDNALETADVTPKSGYLLTYTNPAGAYTVNNDPVLVNSTGVRGFYTDQSIVILVRNPGPGAGPGDPAI